MVSPVMIDVPERRTPSNSNVVGPAGSHTGHAVTDDLGDPELQGACRLQRVQVSRRRELDRGNTRGDRVLRQEQDAEVAEIARVLSEAGHLEVRAHLDRRGDTVAAVRVERDQDLSRLDPELDRRQAMPRGEEDVGRTVLRLTCNPPGSDARPACRRLRWIPQNGAR